MFFIDTSREFANHEVPWTLFEKDQIHPNLKGSMVMVDCIRKRISLSERKQALRSFISKPATPYSRQMSYAESAARPPNTSRISQTKYGDEMLDDPAAVKSGNSSTHTTNHTYTILTIPVCTSRRQCLVAKILSSMDASSPPSVSTSNAPVLSTMHGQRLV